MRHASTDSGNTLFMARGMVVFAPHKVNKKHSGSTVYRCARFRHTACSLPGGRIESYLIIVAVCLVLALLGLWLHDRGNRGRENAIRALLDGADALESRLQECRERMQHLRDMLVVLPEELSAGADNALQADTKVQAALKDLLAHRLWIQQHAVTASPRELAQAQKALNQSGATLQAQLDRLAAISSDLQRAQAEARSVKRPAAS
jgi:uncharacterized protein YukE